MRTIGLSLVLAVLLVLLLPVAESAQENGLPARVAELEAQVEAMEAQFAAMEELLQYVRVETAEINGLRGPHLIIEGANVHVRSGSGSTSDGCEVSPHGDPNCDSLTGMGNVIIGYNEPAWHRIDSPRAGSHNLIIGQEHSYTSFSGLVAGWRNRISGPAASVSGGMANKAIGHGSSVSGGQENDADGVASSISGGLANEANGFASSVNGGFRNSANGHESSVGGGNRNDAIGDQSWISGGKANVAAGTFSSVSGGWSNEAVGQFSSLSGGRDRTVLGDFNWAAGSLFEPN
jgi:hypothetical protein